MCWTFGYGVSLPPDCKNNTTLRHGNPHPTVNLISNTDSGEPRFVSDPCFILFRADMVEVGSFPLVDPLYWPLFVVFIYIVLYMGLRRKWESLVSYSANKPALLIHKPKVDLISQLIGN